MNSWLTVHSRGRDETVCGDDVSDSPTRPGSIGSGHVADQR
jgi:hypothetical protein